MLRNGNCRISGSASVSIRDKTRGISIASNDLCFRGIDIVRLRDSELARTQFNTDVASLNGSACDIDFAISGSIDSVTLTNVSVWIGIYILNDAIRHVNNGALVAAIRLDGGIDGLALKVSRRIEGTLTADNNHAALISDSVYVFSDAEHGVRCRLVGFSGDTENVIGARDCSTAHACVDVHRSSRNLEDRVGTRRDRMSREVKREAICGFNRCSESDIAGQRVCSTRLRRSHELLLGSGCRLFLNRSTRRPLLDGLLVNGIPNRCDRIALRDSSHPLCTILLDDRIVELLSLLGGSAGKATLVQDLSHGRGRYQRQDHRNGQNLRDQLLHPAADSHDTPPTGTNNMHNSPNAEKLAFNTLSESMQGILWLFVNALLAFTYICIIFKHNFRCFEHYFNMFQQVERCGTQCRRGAF